MKPNTLIYGLIFMIFSLSCSEPFIDTEALAQENPISVTLKSATIGTKYYVSKTGNNSNTGSISSPFLTIQKAADVVNPGDTVIVEDGTYTSAVTDIVTLSRSGSPGNLITFRSKNKFGAILDGRTNTTDNGFNITGSYIVIDGFEIKGMGFMGLNIKNCAYVTAKNNNIHDIGRRCTDTVYGQNAIYTSGSNHISIEKNLIHDIGRFEPGENGCSPSTANYKNHDHGIYINGSSYITVNNNILYNIKRGWGIQIYPNTVDNLSVVNNTFAFGNSYEYAGGHIIIAAAVTNSQIANNVFYNHGDGAILLTGTTSPISSIEVKYNITYGGKGTIYSGTATGVAFSNNFNSTDPKMTNPNVYDFTLLSTSPAINAGINVGLSTDYLKNAVIGLPDIGAYEFAGTSTPPTATVYYNTQKSATATKSDCGTGSTGSTVTYTVAAYKYSSTVSQADADSKATADLTANKQAYANVNGICTVIPVTVFYNAQQSATATKNDCGPGATGTTVTYTVAANKFSSSVSQADADSKATADLTANKQTYANSNGTCTTIPVYYNTQKSATATKSDCGTGSTGSIVTYTVTANKYLSTVSQADADNKATADLIANKQVYANANGTCTTIPVYYNTQKSATATKNDCGTGSTGSTVTYIVAANKFSSTVSQADADSKATTDLSTNKQAYANANGTCTTIPVYYNTQKSATATKNDCGTGSTGTTVTYIVAANKFSSTVSQADADGKATADLTANKQSYANANGTCTTIPVYYNTQISATATKNDCGTGSVGTTVTYTVAANKFSSTVSQADADNKATADLTANKQAYANANGTCTIVAQTVSPIVAPKIYYNSQKYASATKNDCGTGYTGSRVIYTVVAKKYSSTVSQSDADKKATADLAANKQAYANANGTCKRSWWYGR